SGPLHAMRYTVTGKLNKVGYIKWLKRQASLNNLHGYGKKLSNRKIEVVAASDDLEKLNKFEKLCIKGPKWAKVDHVSSDIWNKEIMFGFEIQESENKTKQRKMKNELKELHELKKII